jgi:hypothetical protein
VVIICEVLSARGMTSATPVRDLATDTAASASSQPLRNTNHTQVNLALAHRERGCVCLVDFSIFGLGKPHFSSMLARCKRLARSS